MSSYVDFDFARARQMLAEGWSILTRARMLDGVDAAELLEGCRPKAIEADAARCRFA